MINPPQHRFLSDRSAAILARPEKWKVVSSLAPPEHASLKNPGHTDWRQRHIDSHPHVEILFALSGRTAYGFMNAVYPCKTGTVFVFDRFETHDRHYPPGSPDFEHLWLGIATDHIYGRIILSRRGKAESSMERAWLIPAHRMELNFSALCDHLRAERQHLPEAMIRHRLMAGLNMLAAIVLEAGYQPLSDTDRESTQRRTIDMICRHIQQTVGHGESVADLARMAGYSPFHFLRLFKKHTGQTVHQFIDRCRLQKVQELIRRRTPLKEISEEIGFSCPAAFSRWYGRFKKSLL